MALSDEMYSGVALGLVLINEEPVTNMFRQNEKHKEALDE